MFDGFELERIDVGEAVLRVRYGGSGPPVLLLHGHPRTHVTWHRVAPLLAGRHTVVCPDLRGYGQSSKPPTTADHEPYSKRAMARDCVALMRALGHERFAVAGHDRGSYVAFRTAMDHPDRVSALAVLDSIPIGEALARADARFAAAWWHWFFFGQTAKPAERIISRDPDAWYTATAETMGEEAFADYRAAIHDPETVHAMVEDYRAGPRTRPRARRGRPRGGQACAQPHAGRLVRPRRPRGALGRSGRDLARMGRRRPRRADRQRPPHGRGGAGPARGRARRVLHRSRFARRNLGSSGSLNSCEPCGLRSSRDGRSSSSWIRLGMRPSRSVWSPTYTVGGSFLRRVMPFSSDGRRYL